MDNSDPRTSTGICGEPVLLGLMFGYQIASIACMALEATAAIPHESPTLLDSAIFWAKAAVLRKIRSVSDLTQPVRRLGHGTKAGYPVLLAEIRSPLWTDESAVESSLQFGKVQNLRKACRRLHLVEIPAGQLFS